MNFSSTLTISMFIFRSLCSLSFSTSQRCILFKGRKKNHPRYIFTRSDFHDVHSIYRTKTTPTENYKRGEQKTGDKNKKHAWIRLVSGHFANTVVSKICSFLVLKLNSVEKNTSAAFTCGNVCIRCNIVNCAQIPILKFSESTKLQCRTGISNSLLFQPLSFFFLFFKLIYFFFFFHLLLVFQMSSLN